MRAQTAGEYFDGGWQDAARSGWAKDGEFMPEDDEPPVSVSPDALSASRRDRSAVAGANNERGLPVFRQLPPQTQSKVPNDLDTLLDVELDVKIELGRTRMRVEDVLKLVDGAVVELNRSAGDPVDVFVNERLVARGEVIVLNERFAVRVTEVVSPIRGELHADERENNNGQSPP